jgi:hypothetical protein
MLAGTTLHLIWIVFRHTVVRTSPVALNLLLHELVRKIVFDILTAIVL